MEISATRDFAVYADASTSLTSPATGCSRFRHRDRATPARRSSRLTRAPGRDERPVHSEARLAKAVGNLSSPQRPGAADPPQRMLVRDPVSTVSARHSYNRGQLDQREEQDSHVIAGVPRSPVGKLHAQPRRVPNMHWGVATALLGAVRGSELRELDEALAPRCAPLRPRLLRSRQHYCDQLDIATTELEITNSAQACGLTGELVRVRSTTPTIRRTTFWPPPGARARRPYFRIEDRSQALPTAARP